MLGRGKECIHIVVLKNLTEKLQYRTGNRQYGTRIQREAKGVNSDNCVAGQKVSRWDTSRW